jgi:hypothetical protein
VTDPTPTSPDAVPAQPDLMRSAFTPPVLTESVQTPPNGVPLHQPLSHQPLSDQPLSPHQPLSDQPLSPHQPLSDQLLWDHQAPQPPARPSRAPIIALTTLAVVFAIVAGLFTALYAGARSDRDDTATARADKERTLADVTERQDAADEALESKRSRESILTDEHDLLTRCVEAAKGYFDLPAEQSPESSRLFRIMYEVCPQI